MDDRTARGFAYVMRSLLDFPGAKHEIDMWAEISPEIRAILRAAGVLP